MSNEINKKLQSVRTMEDIVNLLSILFTNLNNQSEQYYDMFWNPIPMDLDLEKYNENGVLEVVKHPNVAKMRIMTYSGPGSPNGVQAAAIGSLYIDTLTSDLYYKATGDDSFGWQKIWSTVNLIEGMDFLRPDGDGSQLKNLNADNITEGTLSVKYGGTGRKNITGLIKGNGEAPFSEATAGVDYIAPSSFLGMIMYCPVAVIPEGWLICDGTQYNILSRPELTALCQKLKNKYGGDGITTFKVPNLIDKYIKGGVPANVGKTVAGHVGAHSHTGTTNDTGSHRHGVGPRAAGGQKGTSGSYGTIRIYGSFKTPDDDEPFTNADSPGISSGALTLAYGATYGGAGTDRTGGGILGMKLDTNRAGSWSGQMTVEGNHHHSVTINSGGSGVNEVDHVVMIPVIKY